MAVYVTEPQTPGVLSEHPTLTDAVADLRDYWLESPEGPQCFTVQDDAGVYLAVLLRDRCEPAVCHTLYADGTAEHHGCRYITRPDGSYLRTEVSELEADWYVRADIVAGRIGVDGPLTAA
jgi:hypothetical protein